MRPREGVGREDEKDELRRYLRQVETAMRRLLAGRRSPLVLAGAEPLPSLYREISGYPYLAGDGIPGNPEHLRDDELRDRAWQLLEPTFAEARRRMAERFGELSGTGRASVDVTKILPGACPPQAGPGPVLPLPHGRGCIDCQSTSGRHRFYS